MFLPPVLDPIFREFLWSQKDLYCKNTFWAWTGQGITKSICFKLVCQERMKIIIDQINPCGLVLKKTLQNVLKTLGSNPIILRKLKHCWAADLLALSAFWNNILKVANVLVSLLMLYSAWNAMKGQTSILIQQWLLDIVALLTGTFQIMSLCKATHAELHC